MPLIARKNVSVSDEIDVPHRLNAHHAYEHAICRMAPERNSSRYLAIELVRRHVGYMPAIGRDHAPIGFSCIIDNRQHGVAIVIAARANDANPVLVLVFARHRARPGKNFSMNVFW